MVKEILWFVVQATEKLGGYAICKNNKSLEGMQFARTIKASLIIEGGLLVIIY